MRRLSIERDIPLLRFLWKWKVATTSAVAARFFRTCQPIVAYQRLMALESDGYVQCRASHSGNDFAWMLGPKGFKLVSQTLPELREIGYKSEHIGHDLLVAAAHLGDWLTEQPGEVGLFSEQELRRLHTDHFPKWVPKSEVHRPDGYWAVKKSGGLYVVALEVELSQKSKDFYEDVAFFYQEAQVSQVIWITDCSTTGKRIAHFTKRYQASNESVHSFIDLNEFRKLLWQSPIKIGFQIGTTIRDALAPSVLHSSSIGSGRHFFQTRKKPLSLDTSENFEKQHFFN